MKNVNKLLGITQLLSVKSLDSNPRRLAPESGF